MKKKIVVAVSGGVDSIVAAYLLKKQGFSLINLNFVTGFENNLNMLNVHKKLNEVSNNLNIPFEIVNIKKQFKKTVVDYFTSTYCKGETPNPCLICNQKIKFGLLMSISKKMGASKIATGHYARIKSCINGKLCIAKGLDNKKDQSYFLSRLKQKQLTKIVFPLGNLLKSEVIKIALKNELCSINNKESQDICFIKSKYSKFIDKTIKNPPKPGEIININGKHLGIHSGIHYFTIGQRRGLNCPNSKNPNYVLKIDKIKNYLIVGEKKLLFSSKCIVKNINWVLFTPRKTIKIVIKLRYQHTSSAVLTATSKSSAIIKFNSSQIAITPGQAAVFYIKNRVIGSGWVRKSL